jgi:hypothetical protein
MAAIVVPNKRSSFPALWYSPNWELRRRKQANPEGGLVILSMMKLYSSKESKLCILSHWTCD